MDAKLQAVYKETYFGEEISSREKPMFTKTYTSVRARMNVLALVFAIVLNSAMPVAVSAKPAYAADPPGTLDTSFDGDGLVTTSMSDFRDEGQSVGIQSDGKILVAGVANAHGYSDFALIRYNPDGSLDTNFDTDGKVTTDFAGYADYAGDLALQSDGKIIAAGFSYLNSSGSETDIALARYNTDGSLDTSFDLDGKVSLCSCGPGRWENRRSGVCGRRYWSRTLQHGWVAGYNI
jgi:uncharacterized delta-60 repeat protein